MCFSCTVTVFLGNRAVVLCARSVLGVDTVILESGKVSYSSPSYIGDRKLLYMHSPDTDVYHIGLTLIDPSVHDVYVLSNISSQELRLFQLLLSCRDDPDLSLLPLLLRPCVLQTLFIYAMDVITFHLLA